MRSEGWSTRLWALTLVAAAIVALLRALDVFPEGVSDLLTRAAPALLIFAGLMALLPGRVPLGSILAVAATAGLVVGIALFAYSSREGEQREDQRLPIEQSVSESITLMAVNITTLDTDVEIIQADGDSITGEFVGSTESDISINFVDPGDGSAEFTLEERKSSDFPLLEAVGRGRLLLALPQDIAVAVAFDGEDGSMIFNMGALKVERLNIEVGAGNAVVTLPAYQPLSPNADEQPGRLTVNDGDITIFVPDDVAARLLLNRGGAGIRPEFDPAYILIDDGADGTLEKRDIGENDIPLFFEVTAPQGLITLESIE